VARAIKIYIRGIRPGRIVNSNGRVIGSIVKKKKKKGEKRRKERKRKERYQDEERRDARERERES